MVGPTLEDFRLTSATYAFQARAVHLNAGIGQREEIWAKGVEIFPGLTKEQAWAGDRHIEAFVLKRS